MSNYPPNQPPPGSGPPPGGYPQGGYPQGGYPQGGPPPGYQPKSSNKWIFWLLGGCLGLVIIGAIIIFAVGYWGFNKAKQAGFDPELMQKKPALAVAKMLTALNPDVEVVNADDEKGLITIRDKKTGETITMTVDDAKKGKVSFKKNGKDAGSIELKTDGDRGSLEVKTDQGTAKFGVGTSGKMPGWLPIYPGSSPQWDYSLNNKDGDSGAFHFTTTDSSDRIASYYEDGLKGGGLKVATSTFQAPGQGKTTSLGVQDSSNKRTGSITIQADPSGSNKVVIFFTSKD